jgi:anti-sigma regulatory factor (Ser/Thr protein kinase)
MTSRLRHNALIYESTDEYVTSAVAFLREGLEAGEGAVVAHTPPGLAAVREALGPDAAQVTFVDVSASYTRPARTLAAYHRVYAEQLRQTPALRAVADVQIGPEPGEWDEWMGYEAVFNRSFGHLPAWVLCSYDAGRVPDPVLDTVWRTHPEVVAGDGRRPSGRYEDPDRLLRAIAAQPAPADDLRPIGFGRDLEELRERLARAIVAEGVPEAQVLDMLLAASEVATNAIEHGGGITDVRAGRIDGRFVCEIADAGHGFDDPAAGYLAPRDGTGAGLWVARQLTWEIEFFRSPRGFIARIWL